MKVQIWHEFPVAHTILDWVEQRHHQVVLVGGGFNSYDMDLPVLVLDEQLGDMLTAAHFDHHLREYLNGNGGRVVVYTNSEEPWFHEINPKESRPIRAVIKHGSFRELDHSMCARQFRFDALSARRTIGIDPTTEIEKLTLDQFLSGINLGRRGRRRHILRRCTACRSIAKMQMIAFQAEVLEELMISYALSDLLGIGNGIGIQVMGLDLETGRTFEVPIESVFGLDPFETRASAAPRHMDA